MASQGKHAGGEVASSGTGALVRSAEQSQIDFELEFFDGVLKRYPDYLDVLRVQGNNLTLKGRYAEGLQIDKRLVQLRPHDALAHYNLACSFSLLKKPDLALKTLRRAIELGYRDFPYMREDRDLDFIRHDPRFKQLLREFESKWLGQNLFAMNPLASGTRALFCDPSANHARAAFHAKPRAQVDKVATVRDAVARLVRDGDYLAIGGFGADRLPSAILHEIARQKKQNLGLAGHTATHDFQILCAGNLTGRGQLLQRVDAAYIVGLEARGLSPHARRVMESGTVQVTEWSNYALAVRFKAAAMGLSFLPCRSLLGTDTLRYSAARTIACPFSGEVYTALPALYPDVAAIHVHEADRFGNCRIRGTSVADFDVARAAKKLIVSCERLIPTDEIRADPSRTLIPFYCVDAVCEVPFGSYPGNMPYEYFSDEDHLRLWLDVEKDPVRHQEFLARHIFNVNDFSEYLQLCGGLPRLQELRRQELLLSRT